MKRATENDRHEKVYTPVPINIVEYLSRLNPKKPRKKIRTAGNCCVPMSLLSYGEDLYKRGRICVTHLKVPTHIHIPSIHFIRDTSISLLTAAGTECLDTCYTTCSTLYYLKFSLPPKTACLSQPNICIKTRANCINQSRGEILQLHTCFSSK